MDRSDIQKLANLAQLQISDEAVDEVASSITNVLDLVDQLKAAETANVKPLAHPLDSVQRLRADEVSEPNAREILQAIAPAVENGLFLVPKVID